MTALEAEHAAKELGLEREDLAITTFVRKKIDKTMYSWNALTPNQEWLKGYIAWLNCEGSTPQKIDTQAFLSVHRQWNTICPAPFGNSWFMNFEPTQARELGFSNNKGIASCSLDFDVDGKTRLAYVVHKNERVLFATLVNGTGIIGKLESSVKGEYYWIEFSLFKDTLCVTVCDSNKEMIEEIDMVQLHTSPDDRFPVGKKNTHSAYIFTP